jgi:hypothetical protein
VPSARSPNASTTRAALTWPSPKLRSPGVSMSHPSSPSGSATTDDEVCLPWPVTGLTTPVDRAAAGTSVFIKVDLPTPDGPMKTLIRPVTAARSLVSVRGGSGRLVVSIGRPSGV